MAARPQPGAKKAAGAKKAIDSRYPGRPAPGFDVVRESPIPSQFGAQAASDAAALAGIGGHQRHIPSAPVEPQGVPFTGGSTKRNDNRTAGVGEIPRRAKPTNTSVPAKVNGKGGLYPPGAYGTGRY